MFFGLEIKGGHNQAKPMTLANTLKLSQAVLEPTKNGKKEPVCLVAEYEKKQFILCVLDPTQSWQSPLDLVFEGGSEVKFFLRGTGTVHLTGYENFDDLDDMSLSVSSDDDIMDASDVKYVDASSSEDEEPGKKKRVSKLTNARPSKMMKTNGVKNSPKNLKSAEKKGKEEKKVEDADDDDDDESDDDDYSFEEMDDSEDGEDSDEESVEGLNGDDSDEELDQEFEEDDSDEE